jgi:dephospho-CoA kinase
LIKAPDFPDDGLLRVGLTGGIASGKSTVAALFAAHGVPVIDLDQLAREVVVPGGPGLAAIVQLFGLAVLDSAGRLDRSKLRAQVFHDPAARSRLEELMHPPILAAAVRHAGSAGGPYQLIVAPLLVEFALTGWVDRVLVVDCPVEVQLKRLLARDMGDEALARAILATQATRAQRLAAAHDIIRNDGPSERLPEAVAALDAAYRRLDRESAAAAPGLHLP